MIPPRGSTPPRPVFPARIDPGHPITRGIVMWFLFNEGGGRIAFDVARNHAMAPASGSLTYGPGKFGPSVPGFDGTGTHIDVGKGSSFATPAQVGFCCWLNTNVSNTSIQYLCGDCDSGGTTGQWGVDINRVTPGTLGFIDNAMSAVMIRSNTAVSVGTWNHVAVSCYPRVAGIMDYDIYINGKLDNQATGGNSTRGVQQGFEIGRPGRLSSNYFNGYLEDFRVYNRALSRTEVAFIYNNPFAGLTEPKPYFVGLNAVTAVAPVPNRLLERNQAVNRAATY